MARARNIKPGIMENEELAEVQPAGRLLFIYLWMLADREGRLEDRPKRIAARTFPYDRDIDVDDLLNDLCDLGFIVRYESEKVKCIQILNFSKHQNPHVKERDSTLPAPDKPGAKPAQEPEKTGTSPADSLIPDSLIPDTGFRPLAADGLPAPDLPAISDDSPPCQPVALAVVEVPPFERFWKVYPRRTKRQQAEKAFAKVKPDVDFLIADINNRLAQGHWTLDAKTYIPHPSTYLNQALWTDEVIPRAGKPMDVDSVANRTNALIAQMNSGDLI